MRDLKGDLSSAEAMAKSLEAEKVDLIYAVATSVTVAAKRATTSVPIVFYGGTDPVRVGLVQSYAKPGGRLTGIHGRYSDITAKRFELLKLMVPGLRRVVSFYDPENPTAQGSVKFAREAARQFNVTLIERTVSSVEALRAALGALRPGEADALFYIPDAMVTSQSQFLIDTALAKKLPTFFTDSDSVAKGALAAYGASYYTVGKLCAKHVHRVLLGAKPGDLPIEQVDRLHFSVNLKTAKLLGLTVPRTVIARADEIIE